MCDNMIVNVSGLPGHFMAVNLNIEHLIGYLRVQKLLKDASERALEWQTTKGTAGGGMRLRC